MGVMGGRGTLPESPPDSSSEPYSPQQVNGKSSSEPYSPQQVNGKSSSEPYSPQQVNGKSSSEPYSPHGIAVHQAKKRKHADGPDSTLNSQILTGIIKQEPVDIVSGPGVMADADNSYLDPNYQCIKWQPHQQNKWTPLYDVNCKEL
nr:myelin regulatory factor-like [Oncorhynchus nerka]